LFQTSRRSKNKYGVAAAIAASTQPASSGAFKISFSWLAKKRKRSPGNDANAVMAR
jgi:hypothetical protein